MGSVALCYGIDDSLLRRLRPWIRIGRRYAIAPRDYRPGRIVDERRALRPRPFRIDTVSARYLRAIGALSKRQAEAFVRWRDASGIYDMEELAACYPEPRPAAPRGGTRPAARGSGVWPLRSARRSPPRSAAPPSRPC